MTRALKNNVAQVYQWPSGGRLQYVYFSYFLITDPPLSASYLKRMYIRTKAADIHATDKYLHNVPHDIDHMAL